LGTQTAAKLNLTPAGENVGCAPRTIILMQWLIAIS
jgi:hypothetical protein